MHALVVLKRKRKNLQEFVTNTPDKRNECNKMTKLCSFSLKVEYDKLANEKTEMQRHYVMVR